MNRLPAVSLNNSPDPAYEYQQVLLDGHLSITPSPTYITKYEWDFTNDGTYDHTETINDEDFDGKTTHAYSQTGTYTVKLRVTNSAGRNSTVMETVTVDSNSITYTYDSVGNRTSMVDRYGTTHYSHDYLGRLKSVSNPDSKTIRYQYDENGNRTQLTDPDNHVTTYTYNGNNRLTEVSAPAGTTTYQYDSLNRLERADYHYPNGTYTLYTYDPNRNWLLSVVNRNSSDANLSSYRYTYDAAGNRKMVTEEDDSTVSYDYDHIYQLTSETRAGTNAYTITYKYDRAGNRTKMIRNGITTAYTYYDDNRLHTETPAGGSTVTCSYDDNGNLTSKTGGISYKWDWRNLLLSVTASGSTTSYEYNGDGQRISKTQGGVKTKYINDVGLGLVQVLTETNNAGTTQAIYNYGIGLISMYRSSTHYNCLSDALGSTRQLTNSSQTVANSYTYDSFGNVIASSGSITNPYGFTGQQQFGEADGLMFLRERYYDPKIGRFISKDPIGYNGGLNLYKYCKDNPVNYTDPQGTDSSSCIDKINSAIKLVEKAVVSGKCKKWFDDRGGFSGPFRVHLRSSMHPICKAGAYMWTWPFSKDISVCPVVCGDDIETIALLLIHEIAHHYAGMGPGREDCASSAMEACGGEMR